MFTDTNSVICKIIAGSLASLFEGGGICEANDGGSVVHSVGHSPSHGLRRASPLTEGAKGCHRKGERYMKATGIVRRADDLGRIVIPKEIRRTLKIREGDPHIQHLHPRNDSNGRSRISTYGVRIKACANNKAEQINRLRHSLLKIKQYNVIII